MEEGTCIHVIAADFQTIANVNSTIINSHLGASACVVWWHYRSSIFSNANGITVRARPCLLQLGFDIGGVCSFLIFILSFFSTKAGWGRVVMKMTLILGMGLAPINFFDCKIGKNDFIIFGWVECINPFSRNTIEHHYTWSSNTPTCVLSWSRIENIAWTGWNIRISWNLDVTE